MLEPFLTSLAQDLELDEPLQKNTSNQFTLTLNPEQIIILEETGEEILLKAQIGLFPQGSQEVLCIHLMKGNFLGQGTGKSVIGLEENEKFLTLSCALPYDINYKTFKLLLEEFANYLFYWQEELVNATQGEGFNKE